jgi:Ca2+-binding EF-hand superfamily protein
MSKAELIAAFTKFDKDKSGTINASELREILCRDGSTQMDTETAEAVLQSLLASGHDSNGDGKLSIEELAGAFCNDEAEVGVVGEADTINHKLLAEMFDVADTDKNGSLSPAELHAALGDEGGSEAVFKWLDAPHQVWNAGEGDGKITKDEWIKGQLAAYPADLYSAAEIAKEIDDLHKKVLASKK